MITLKFMRYLTTAVRCGSITEAASQLNISASAISAAIDQIEEHFDLKLVSRHRARGVQATTSGRVLIKKFQVLLDDYEDVLLGGADLKQAMTGTLRIGYYSPVAPAFLPQIISEMSAVHGALSLHLEECDNDKAQDGLLNGRFDAIIFVANAAQPQINYQPLIEVPAYCLLPEAHPLTARPAIDLSDLNDEPIIVLDRPLATEYYQKLFENTARAPNNWILANSTEMVRSLVGAGFGCSILNMVPKTQITYAGERVVARPLVDDLPGLLLAVGYDHAKPRALVREFARACVAYFAAQSAQEIIVRNDMHPITS